MFNVNRGSINPPDCTKQKGYNTEAIVKALEKLFYGKCYLCEQSALADPEIEHFTPHNNQDAIKYKWSNLYYSCSRCNSIKGSKHVNLLDCCDSATDVFKAIRIYLPTVTSENVIVIPVDKDDKKSLNTAELLHQCYNERATGLRGITRSALIEKMQGEYLHLLIQAYKVKDHRTTPNEAAESAERIQLMLEDNYPFSAIWRWFVIGDENLRKKLPDNFNYPIVDG